MENLEAITNVIDIDDALELMQNVMDLDIGAEKLINEAFDI